MPQHPCLFFWNSNHEADNLIAALQALEAQYARGYAYQFDDEVTSLCLIALLVDLDAALGSGSTTTRSWTNGVVPSDAIRALCDAVRAGLERDRTDGGPGNHLPGDFGWLQAGGVNQGAVNKAEDLLARVRYALDVFPVVFASASVQRSAKKR